MPKSTDLFARISRQLRPDERISTYTLHAAHRDDGPPLDKVFTWERGWDGPISETLAARLRSLRAGGGGNGSRLGPHVFEVATREEVKKLSMRERLARLNKDADDPEMEALDERLRWSTEPERVKNEQRAEKRAVLAKRKAKAEKTAPSTPGQSPRAGTRPPAPPSRRVRAAPTM